MDPEASLNEGELHMDRIDRILRFPEVKSASGLKRSSIYNRIKEGLFPKPITLGPRMVGWRESEIAAVNNAWVRGASVDEIRTLVEKLEASRQAVA